MSETPGYVKNLKKESVVQSVINCLTDAMRNKELKPGDRIPPEPELAASMGVARSSVREAIKILSYLGVLESKRSEEKDGRALEALLDQMKEIIRSGSDEVDRFFEVDNQFHDLISQMGKNPLADKISRVVRTLTHAVRYDTVTTMINSGRGDELVAAHSQLLEMLKGDRANDVEAIVRTTYFEDAIHGTEAK